MRRTARLLAMSAAAATLFAAAPAVAAEISAEEQQFVYELNVARSDPAAYAAAHLTGSTASLVASFPAMPPLAVSEVVGAAAQLRDDDMATNCYFAHFNPVTGDGPEEALNAVGYSSSGWGENIGLGYPDAIAMLNGFLNSNSGHRESVMGVTGSGNKEIGVGFIRTTGCADSYYRNLWTAILARPSPNRVFATGVVYADDDGDGRMDLGEGVPGVTVTVGGNSTVTNDGGGWSIPVDAGTATIQLSSGGSTTLSVGDDNVWVELGLSGAAVPSPCPDGADCDGVTVVDTGGRWHLHSDLGSGAGVDTFFFGNPGDVAFTGDWDCDGTATPGLYRRSDGFVYLRNSNSQGVADREFFFGNPGDLPIAGDFDGDGCDSVGIYRPAAGRFFVINELGADGGGLGAAEKDFLFGNPGDKPFVGDFDGDGVDTVGLHRESTGLVYFRNSHTTGVADAQFVYGDPGDIILAGDWDGSGGDTVGVYRPSSGMLYLNLQNAAGNADYTIPVGNGHVAAAAS